MLAYQWHKTTGIPVVFLHGLLGSQHDWASCFAHLSILPQIRPLTLDLPCHGNSQQITCQHFSDLRQQLHTTLTELIDEPFWLVGYSLGGRIALDYSVHCLNSQRLGTILEGTNIGLQTATERQARLENDQKWARRFQTEPIAHVLADWYQQPVFKGLTADKRLDLITHRQQNCGERIAQMLLATSLATQDDFSTHDWHNLYFLIGERDNKFCQLATQHRLPHRLIENAGHNAHWENPLGFMQQLKQIINNHTATRN